MNEPFLITVDCSKILGGNTETQYTMFIDNTKMSIVYELVEWIRWIFTIEDCFYLTHENSIIHELEDIQVLSKLKTFELKGCGQPNCVHKKIYRTLLKDLNLLVNWNNFKVHKYFLQKISEIDQKLAKENHLNISNSQSMCSSSILRKSATFDQISCLSPVESVPAVKNYKDENKNAEEPSILLSDRKKKGSQEKRLMKCSTTDTSDMEKTPVFDNLEPQFHLYNQSPFQTRNYSKNETENGSVNLMNSRGNSIINDSAPFKSNNMKSSNSISSISPLEKKVETPSSSSINSRGVKRTTRHSRPFSLGEMIQNMREEYKKQTDERNSSASFLNTSQDEYFEDKTSITSDMNDDFINPAEKKRKRSRRRKRAKKENPMTHEAITQPLENRNISWSMKSPYNEVKRKHLRFTIEDEVELMETESIENGSEIVEEIKETGCPDLLQTNVQEVMSLISEKKQALLGPASESQSLVGNENPEDVDCRNKTLQTDNQIRTDENKIVFNGNHVDSVNDGTQNCTLNQDNHNLNDLLTLKEKFKNAVVVERFY